MQTELSRDRIFCLAWRDESLALKTSNMGHSCCETFGAIRSVTLNQEKLQLLPFSYITSGFFRQCEWSVVVSHLSFIDFTMIGAGEITEALDGGIAIKRLPYIINLPASIDSGWIRKKENARNWKALVRDIEKFAVGLSPDAVELSFDKDLWPFPNRPSDYLFAAIRGDVLRNNSKAFTGWGTGKGADRNVKRRRVPNDASAKRNNVRLNQFGGSQVMRFSMGCVELILTASQQARRNFGIVRDLTWMAGMLKRIHAQERLLSAELRRKERGDGQKRESGGYTRLDRKRYAPSKTDARVRSLHRC